MVIRLPRNSPLWTSLILHAAALVVLLFFVLLDFFRAKQSVHVFEMVSPPNVPVAQNIAPSPKAVVEPTPAPPKPKPRELININDFRKKNPLPKPRPVQTPDRAPVMVPTLTVPEIETSRSQTPPRELSQQELTDLANYNARLRSRINAAWKKPANLGGLALKLNAVFRVSSSGVISQIRFSPGSGNAAFDASVMAALEAVANAGRTPTGQAHTFSMTFGQD